MNMILNFHKTQAMISRNLKLILIIIQRVMFRKTIKLINWGKVQDKKPKKSPNKFNPITGVMNCDLTCLSTPFNFFSLILPPELMENIRKWKW